jgi:ribosomal-protein-alanine N-acetyltransferase
MSVRAAVADDAPVLAAIHGRCFGQGWSEHSFRALLSDEVVFGLLAGSAEGSFRSFLLARAAGGEAEILMLATVPEARREGLASTLLNAAIEQAVRRGAAGLFLEVGENNLPAAALYAKFGFREVGRRPAYFVSPGQQLTDARILRKDLPAS